MFDFMVTIADLVFPGPVLEGGITGKRVDVMADIRSPAGGLIFASAGKRLRQLREDSVCILFV